MAWSKNSTVNKETFVSLISQYQRSYGVQYHTWLLTRFLGNSSQTLVNASIACDNSRVSTLPSNEQIALTACMTLLDCRLGHVSIQVLSAWFRSLQMAITRSISFSRVSAKKYDTYRNNNKINTGKELAEWLGNTRF